MRWHDSLLKKLESTWQLIMHIEEGKKRVAAWVKKGKRTIKKILLRIWNDVCLFCIIFSTTNQILAKTCFHCI